MKTDIAKKRNSFRTLDGQSQRVFLIAIVRDLLDWKISSMPVILAKRNNYYFIWWLGGVGLTIESSCMGQLPVGSLSSGYYLDG